MAGRRDISVDVVRGLAILTMVAANVGGMALEEPHPFWFRLYGTFAAPLFIMMSGMMVVRTAAATDRGLKYYLVRGGMVMLVGVLLDIIVWQIYPFISVDVLYLIGLSLPIAYLAARTPAVCQWGAALGIVVATPMLQYALGYADFPREITLAGDLTQAPNHVSVLNHWLVDGWFPVFPWLAFSLFGAALGGLRARSNSAAGFATIRGAGAAFVVLAGGIFLWWQNPGALLTRQGYSELFYPPTIGYILTAAGVAILAFSFVDLKPALFLYAPLQALGEASLFMYILHLTVGEYVILPITGKNDRVEFLTIYVVLMAVLIAVAYGLRLGRAQWRSRPFLVRFLIG